jgi:hypothetical protein
LLLLCRHTFTLQRPAAAPLFREAKESEFEVSELSIMLVGGDADQGKSNSDATPDFSFLPNFCLHLWFRSVRFAYQPFTIST